MPRYSVPLVAGKKTRLPYPGRSLQVVDTGTAGSVDLEVEWGGDQQNSEALGSFESGDSVKGGAGAESFSALSLTAAVDTTVDLLISKREVALTNGQSVNVAGTITSKLVKADGTPVDFAAPAQVQSAAVAAAVPFTNGGAVGTLCQGTTDGASSISIQTGALGAGTDIRLQQSLDGITWVVTSVSYGSFVSGALNIANALAVCSVQGKYWRVVQNAITGGASVGQVQLLPDSITMGVQAVMVNTLTNGLNSANGAGAGAIAAGLVAQYDDATPVTPTDKFFSNLRMSAERALHVRQYPAAAKALTPSYVSLAAGDNVIVAAAAGKTTRVHRMKLSANAAVTITVKDGATVIDKIYVSNGVPVILEFSAEAWYKTAVNSNFTLNASAACEALVEAIQS